jgi:hypothetical protein
MIVIYCVNFCMNEISAKSNVVPQTWFNVQLHVVLFLAAANDALMYVYFCAVASICK